MSAYTRPELVFSTSFFLSPLPARAGRGSRAFGHLPEQLRSVSVTGSYSWNSVLRQADRLSLTSSPGSGWTSLPGLSKLRCLHTCYPLTRPI